MALQVSGAYADLLQRPALRVLLAGFGVSLLGDGLSVVSVAALALDLGAGPHRALVVGGAVAAYTLPAVVGGLALRRWLSGLEPRRLVWLDAGVRASALGAIAVVRACGALNPAIYIALLAVSSVLLSWSYAGRYTLVGAYTEPAERLAANAMMTGLDSAAFIAGPAVAGALLVIVDPAALIACDAASYVLLALALTRLPARPVGDVVATRPDGTGWSFLRGHRQLVALLMLSAAFFFLYGPIEVAIPVFVADHHGVHALGVYWAVFGLGALSGALAAGGLGRLPLWRTAIAVVFGWGAALTVFGFTSALVPTLVAFGVGGLIWGPYPALSATLFQNETPPARLTSVLAARSAILTGCAPLGTALGGPLVAAIGARSTILASGAATVVLAVVASPLIRRDRRPAVRSGSELAPRSAAGESAVANPSDPLQRCGETASKLVRARVS